MAKGDAAMTRAAPRMKRIEAIGVIERTLLHELPAAAFVTDADLSCRIYAIAIVDALIAKQKANRSKRATKAVKV